MNPADRIQPYRANPWYWQFRGKPVMLLGGSREDNLFQIPEIEQHLDLLKSVGGNYVRGTMSSRDEGDVWPFGRREDGKYDLNTWGDEYWRRFSTFLDLAEQRDVIVQIEVWDRFDFAREPWQLNPFNPKLNVNYTEAESGLKPEITTHPGQRESAFFRTVPALEDNGVVLRYQRAFVEKMLSYTLGKLNVLYCMDNETNESPEWPEYWARFIAERAKEAGTRVELTEMWDQHDITHEMHAATWQHPELYSFCDISQNNHQQGQRHWDNMQGFRAGIAETGHLRPINMVKIYGANTGRYGTNRDAIERFWRAIVGGVASVRFHRPPAGIGLSKLAQTHVRSGRMLCDAIDLTRSEPHNDLLGHRSADEAYCTARPGEHYAVFFPDGGDVTLDCSAAATGELTVRWLDIEQSEWGDEQTVTVSGQVQLTTPRQQGYWAVVLRP